MRHHIEISL